MRSWSTGVVLTWLLAGCGWSEARFEVDGIDALCEQAAACAGTFDTAACVDALRTTDRDGCDYDGRAARQCARDTVGAACVTDPVFGTSTLEVPVSCLEVYDCEWIDLAPFERPGSEG